ncbi:hypothetical protein CEXT_258741 [Caerostris extrusa]|uniref:Uncharacterized protein n=1 Tax=Caerostris extrusa TaxID=172846 RepID=A0AAV4X501_CAEEX|nr:hypothetical protein CEXT_258741 [Caerostris extrusa]
MSSFKFCPEDIRSPPKEKENRFCKTGVLKNPFTYLSYKMTLPSANERNSHQITIEPKEKRKSRDTKPGRPQEEKGKKMKIAENSSSEEKIDIRMPSNYDDFNDTQKKKVWYVSNLCLLKRCLIPGMDLNPQTR